MYYELHKRTKVLDINRQTDHTKLNFPQLVFSPPSLPAPPVSLETTAPKDFVFVLSDRVYSSN